MADEMTLDGTERHTLTTPDPISIREPIAPRLVIHDGAGRELVCLETGDGRMRATYDPAHLDEAARIFWDSMARYFNANCTEGLGTDG